MTHERIPKAELAAMRAREEAATKEPWEVEPNYNSPRNAIMAGKQRIAVVGETSITNGDPLANAELMAHARTDQPRLRRTYEALLAENARLRDGLREARIELDKYHTAAQSREGWQGE